MIACVVLVPYYQGISVGIFDGILRNVFIDDKRCVYIDFERALTERHGGGTQGELLTLEALKKTIAANYPELDFVKVLVEGKEIASLAGHISTRGQLKVR